MLEILRHQLGVGIIYVLLSCLNTLSSGGDGRPILGVVSCGCKLGVAFFYTGGAEFFQVIMFQLHLIVQSVGGEVLTCRRFRAGKEALLVVIGKT